MIKDEWRMMNDEWWRLKMKDDDFKLLRGFADGQTDRHFVIVEMLLWLKKDFQTDTLTVALLV